MGISTAAWAHEAPSQLPSCKVIWEITFDGESNSFFPVLGGDHTEKMTNVNFVLIFYVQFRWERGQACPRHKPREQLAFKGHSSFLIFRAQVADPWRGLNIGLDLPTVFHDVALHC